MKFDSVLLPHLPRNITEAKVRSLLDVRFSHTPQAIEDIVDNCGLEFARAFIYWLMKTPEGKSWLCGSLVIGQLVELLQNLGPSKDSITWQFFQNSAALIWRCHKRAHLARPWTVWRMACVRVFTPTVPLILPATALI